jgi:hypothetical protein
MNKSVSHSFFLVLAFSSWAAPCVLGQAQSLVKLIKSVDLAGYTRALTIAGGRRSWHDRGLRPVSRGLAG